MSISLKAPKLQAAVLEPLRNLVQKRVLVTPEGLTLPVKLGAVPVQSPQRGPNNSIWAARETPSAPHASGLLSGVGPAASALSGRMFCEGLGGFFRRIFGGSDSNSDSDSTSTTSGNTLTISLVYVNDNHGRYTPEANGGNPFARVSGYRNKVLEENPHTILVNGGDVYEKGDPTELFTGGYTTRAAFEAVGFDIGVIGNHDFAWSVEELLAYSRAPNTVMLGSNIKYVGDDETEYGGVEYHVREFGGVRFGFFGMVSKGYDERDSQTDADYYPDKLATRHDYETRARELVKTLREEEKVDVIVMANHLGVKVARELAESVEGIDAILSSHSHDKIEEVVNGVPIIQADAYSRYIGRLDIVWDLDAGRIVDHSMELIKNDSSVPTDPMVRDKINAIVEEHMIEDDFATVERSLENKAEIAEVACNAAIYHLNVPAVMLEEKMIWQDSWEPGTLTLEKLARTFEVEREPAGTPGFSSFYTIEVAGSELTLIRASGLWSGRKWVHAGVDDPQADQTYTLALPKKVAMNLKHYLNIPERECAPACEIWEAVYAYGLHQTAEGKYIDA